MPQSSIALLVAIVVSISDGDTLTILHDQQQVRIRLAEIDAPEKNQPFGMRSKQSLSDLCFRKQAEVIPNANKDRYGRTVARVRCDGVDANAEQVRLGMAWVYTKYSHDPALPPLEQEAKAARRGLWADHSPAPPWEWRHPPR